MCISETMCKVDLFAPQGLITTAVVVMSSVTPNTNTELETYKVEPLKGSANYRTWKFSMRMVLQARDLWEVVSGEEVKPEAEAAAQAWEKKARKALATIALALSAAEKEHIIECTTP